MLIAGILVAILLLLGLTRLEFKAEWKKLLYLAGILLVTLFTCFTAYNQGFNAGKGLPLLPTDKSAFVDSEVYQTVTICWAGRSFESGRYLTLIKDRQGDPKVYLMDVKTPIVFQAEVNPLGGKPCLQPFPKQ